ncbi:MAG TPA: hypothetical protein VFT88_06935 [Acidobacteriaceae bacterium]|jgi:hypothetical protein|nr:hypothetical protein [Acidobacteriaceae bacterium]
MDDQFNAGQSEGKTTAYVESQTSKLPSGFYLGAALASMGISLGFKLAGKNQMALFVGQWAAPFLVIGTYNKIVKQRGSDRSARWEHAA